MSKIVLVGANHAGTAAANTLLDNYQGNQLTVFDANSNISYLGCGTALWVGRQIHDPSQLFYSSKEALEAKHAKVHMETKITNIDFNTKTVYACDKNGHTFTESYDKLVLATGSKPIMPPIPGLDLDGVHFVKLFQDGQKIDEALNGSNINSVAVIGAGYIGVEIAEAIQRRGKKALLFEASSTSLSGYYDEPFCHEMDKVLAKNGIELHYNEKVQEIVGGTAAKAAPKPHVSFYDNEIYTPEFNAFLNALLENPRAAFDLPNATSNRKPKVQKIVTDKGEYAVDLVIMAIGFLPNTELGKNTLETLPNGAYKVNLRQETSLPGVYAVGDCASIYSNAIQNYAYIALATNAVRSGIIAGHNVGGTPLESNGVQGSNGICIYDYKMVSTGLNVNGAKRFGYDPEYTDFEALQKPGFIKESNEQVKIRIIYDKNTRRILGAQMASYQDVSMGIHMFSLAIEQGVTIDKLKLLDIFFMPHFNQPYNYITMAALGAK